MTRAIRGSPSNTLLQPCYQRARRPAPCDIIALQVHQTSRPSTHGSYQPNRGSLTPRHTQLFEDIFALNVRTLADPHRFIQTAIEELLPTITTNPDLLLVLNSSLDRPIFPPLAHEILTNTNYYGIVRKFVQRFTNVTTMASHHARFGASTTTSFSP